MSEPILAFKVEKRATGLTSVDPIDPPRRLSGGAGYMTWHRFAVEVLKAAGELRDGEKLVGIVVDEDGIQYFTERE